MGRVNPERTPRKLSEVAASVGSTVVTAIITLAMAGFALLVGWFFLVSAWTVVVNWYKAAKDTTGFIHEIYDLWLKLPPLARGTIAAIIGIVIAGYITLIVMMNIEEHRTAPPVRAKTRPAQPQQPAAPAREHGQAILETDNDGYDSGDGDG